MKKNRPKRKTKRPLIVIESINGAGGSTQSGKLVKKLKQEGFQPTFIHFHQRDRATGQLIEEKFLHSSKPQTFSRREQALLYIQDFFSRQEDIEKVVNGSRKSVVVCDRYYTSTLAYQTINLSGLKRDSMLEWITWLVSVGRSSLPQPDLVILLDISPHTSLAHLKRADKDLFENFTRQRQIRTSYLKLAREQNWTVIDSMLARRAGGAGGKQRSIKDIHKEIWSHVEPLL